MRVVEAVAARRAADLPVFDLSVGQPSTSAPRAVRAAAQAALEHDRLGYTGVLGLASLRDAIAGHYSHAYSLDVDRTAVVATTGFVRRVSPCFPCLFRSG